MKNKNKDKKDYPIIITEEMIKQVQENDYTVPKIKGLQQFVFVETNKKEREFKKYNKIPIPIDKEIANKLKDQ